MKVVELYFPAVIRGAPNVLVCAQDPYTNGVKLTNEIKDG